MCENKNTVTFMSSFDSAALPELLRINQYLNHKFSNMYIVALISLERERLLLPFAINCSVYSA